MAMSPEREKYLHSILDRHIEHLHDKSFHTEVQRIDDRSRRIWPMWDSQRTSDVPETLTSQPPHLRTSTFLPFSTSVKETPKRRSTSNYDYSSSNQVNLSAHHVPSTRHPDVDDYSSEATPFFPPQSPTQDTKYANYPLSHQNSYRSTDVNAHYNYPIDAPTHMPSLLFRNTALHSDSQTGMFSPHSSAPSHHTPTIDFIAGSPMGRLARAERSVRQLRKQKAELEQRLSEVNRENNHLREKLKVLEGIERKYATLEREYNSLVLSFRHSEEARRQQKELLQAQQHELALRNVSKGIGPTPHNATKHKNKIGLTHHRRPI